MGIKLSFSNIAWGPENDQPIYEYMKEVGLQGVEIAPTRWFLKDPFDKKAEVKLCADNLENNYGLRICSIQSIWYGLKENIFGSAEERDVLRNYSKQAIDFAEAIAVGNIVFGCPKNRIIGENENESIDIALSFFRELGEYACNRGTVVAIEANPVIYGTNFLNKTQEAIDFIKKVDSQGFKLNMDVGTIIYNEESIDELVDDIGIINHVHISEPYLKLIEKRDDHRLLMEMLKNAGYDRYVSVEMGRRENIEDIYRTIDYLISL